MYSLLDLSQIEGHVSPVIVRLGVFGVQQDGFIQVAGRWLELAQLSVSRASRGEAGSIARVKPEGMIQGCEGPLELSHAPIGFAHAMIGRGELTIGPGGVLSVRYGQPGSAQLGVNVTPAVIGSGGTGITPDGLPVILDGLGYLLKHGVGFTSA